MPPANPAAGRKTWLTAAVAVALSGALFALVALRIVTVGVTGPEALLIDGPATGEWLDILRFQAPGDPAANDVLAVLAVKAAVLALGPADGVARLPALLGTFLFLAGMGLAANRLFSGWGRIVGAVAVGFNPYVVDALGLARGDALGLGFTLLGTGALAAALGRTPGRLGFWASAAAMACFVAAAFARASYLPVAGAGLIVLTVAAVAVSLRRPLPLNLLAGAGRLIVLAALTAPLPLYGLFVLETGPFPNAAGPTGWAAAWDLIEGTAYGAYPASHPEWLLTGWAAATALVVPFALTGLWREDRRHFAAVAGVWALTLLTFGGFIGLWAVADWFPLPLGRPLAVVPLFTLSALSLIALLRLPSRALVVAGGLAGAVVPAWLGFHGVLSVNLSVTFDSRADAAARDLVAAAGAWAERQPVAEGTEPAPMRLIADAALVPAAEHYRRMLNLTRLAPVTAANGEDPASLRLIRDDGDSGEAEGWRTVARSRLAGTRLMERLP
jgi:hypothetical protein